MNSGDVIMLTFSRAMAAPDVRDRMEVGPLDHRIVCGANASCERVLDTGSNEMRIIRVTLTQRPVAPTDPVAAAQLPAEIRTQDGFTDEGGNEWDLVASPDKTLDCTQGCG